jgi:hypothetical protein
MKGGVLHIKDLKQIESFNIDKKSPIYNIICKIYSFNDLNYIDFDWFEKQIEYINNLSDRQKHIIRSYTIYSDKLINNYLRNRIKKDDIDSILDYVIQLNENPFKYQHFDKTGNYEINQEYKNNINEYIEQYIIEFTYIINNSPKLTKSIKVFRGIRTDNYLIQNIKLNENNNKFIKNIDFLSTSIYLESATNFMLNECCILELTLNINTPCLFTAYISRRRGEFEITIAPNTIMTNIIETKKFLLNEPEYYKSTNIFIEPDKYDLQISKIYEANITI